MDKDKLKLGDINSQKRFHQYFVENLKDRPPNTFRFFERPNNIYSVHGKEECDFVAKIVFKSVSGVKILGFSDISSALPSHYYLTLTRKQFEEASRNILLVKNYRLELYINNKNSWNLEYFGSPGNLTQFEDLIFSNKDGIVGTGMLSLKFQRVGNENKLGIVSVDTNNYEFLVAEFLDNDFFAELESILVGLSPKECLVNSTEGEFNSKINEILERNGILVTVLDKKIASSKTWKSDLLQDLRHILKFEEGQKEDPNTLPEINMEISMNALSSAVKYMQITSDLDNSGRFVIKKMSFEK